MIHNAERNNLINYLEFPLLPNRPDPQSGINETKQVLVLVSS